MSFGVFGRSVIYLTALTTFESNIDSHLCQSLNEDGIEAVLKIVIMLGSWKQRLHQQYVHLLG